MSGVSITSAGAGFDMDAIVAGGPDLLKRMSDFKEQRDAAVQALADLNLGKSAAEARDTLARDRAAFEEQKKAELDNLAKHVAAIKADTDAWKRETVAKHMADREAAAADRAEAARILSETKAERQASAKERADIAAERAKLDETKKAVAAAQNLLGAL
jgi:colicin import membrane protein